MAVELGAAYISLIPSMKGFAPAVAKQLGATSAVSAAAGAKSGAAYKGGFSKGVRGMKTGALAIAAGVGALVTSSVNLEKKFSQTMSVIGATTGAPKKELKTLSDLALKLGADTSFSASEAADAMLELARAGLDPATIKSGALAGTLQLAAAGGTDLSTAATIAANAMNTFNLKGKDMSSISAALAGGANASTASVESLGQALSQVGPGAKNAGLDLNDTVGVLAAFDNAGIKGSDAGTSLKTMLTRLVPQTKKARNAMKELGLKFTDAHGQFLPITDIAQQLQDKMSGLSQAERTAAMSTIFGSDATRAATVLMEEGSKGLGKYIKATKDKDAAEKAANARMSGTAGALERLSGSWETFRLQLGLKIAPIIQTVSDKLGTLIDFLGRHSDVVIKAGMVLAGFAATVLGLNAAMAVGRGIVSAWTAVTKIWTAVTKVATVAMKLFNLAIRANPIGLIITAIGLLVGALVWFFTKTKLGQKIVTTVWNAIKVAVQAVANWFTGTLAPVIKKVWAAIATGAQWLYKYIIKPVWLAIKIIIGIVVGLIIAYVKSWIWVIKNVVAPVVRWLYNKVIKPVWNAIRGAIQAVVKWFRVTAWPIFQRVIGWISGKFNKFKTALKIVWAFIKNNVIRPVVAWFRDNVWPIIKRVIGFFINRFNRMRDSIKAAWSFIKNKVIAPVANWLRDVIQPRIKSFVDGVKRAFGKLRDGIKKIWNKIKSFVKTPAKFIVDTVYNKGIVKLVNAAWDFITPGKKKVLNPVDMSGWATGGWTGPGSKYQPAGVVHADEFVVKKSSRRMFERNNPGVLDYINRTGRMPGYAGGGIVAAANWWRRLGAVASEHPSFGGVSYGAHMKGSKHYTGDAVDLNKGAGTSFAEQSFFDKHLQAFRMAFPNIHVLWRVPNHFNHMHIDNSRGGSRIGGGGGGFDPLGIISKLRNLRKGLSTLADSPVGEMFKGVGKKVINKPLNWLLSHIGKLGDDGKGHAYTGNTDVQKRVRAVAMKYGWGLGNQWAALDWIINKESSWNPNAANPSSSARGLFQKMTSIHGPLEKTIEGQAKWGLNYIKSRYGTPVAAQMFHQGHGYYADGGRVLPKLYDQGGWLPRGLSVVENRTSKPERILNEDQWDRMTSQNQGPLIGQLVVRDEKTAVREFRREQQRMRVRNNMAGR